MVKGPAQAPIREFFGGKRFNEISLLLIERPALMGDIRDVGLDLGYLILCYRAALPSKNLRKGFQ
jgi:hypothetical protein